MSFLYYLVLLLHHLTRKMLDLVYLHICLDRYEVSNIDVVVLLHALSPLRSKSSSLNF